MPNDNNPNYSPSAAFLGMWGRVEPYTGVNRVEQRGFTRATLDSRRSIPVTEKTASERQPYMAETYDANVSRTRLNPIGVG